jgi:hypothetical protein
MRAASMRTANEERRFLLFLTVPRVEAADADTTMCLVRVVCSYRNAATSGDVSVTAEDTVVARPLHAVDDVRSTEVERERVRVEAAEDIAAARAAAEQGAYQEAVEILENRQRAVAQSGDGDTAIMALSAELQEMRGRVSSQQNYAQSGRAYMLAGMSAHAQQRANSRQMMQAQVPVFGAAVQDEATLAYATPAMRAMLLRSRRASAEQGQEQQRQQEQQQQLQQRPQEQQQQLQ